MSEHFELQFTVRGPEYTEESRFGPRTDRSTFASVTVPIEGPKAWKILAYVVDAVKVGRVELREMTDEEREDLVEANEQAAVSSDLAVFTLTLELAMVLLLLVLVAAAVVALAAA